MIDLTRFIRRLLPVLLTSMLLVGCASRYRLDLYLTGENVRTKVKVEQTQHIPGTVLGDPYRDPRILSGDGSTALVTMGFRGESFSGFTHFGIGFDQYVRHRLYLQLPAVPESDTIALLENSFMQMLGQYDITEQDKIFLPVEGLFVIDSVTSDRLFGTISGTFENPQKVPVSLDGRFKMKLGE